MASNWFIHLKNQMNDVKEMLVLHEGLVETVKGVQASLDIEYTGWTQAMKGDVDDELMTAERCVKDMCRKEELLVALARARRLLAETQVVDVPGAAGAAGQGDTEAKPVGPQDLDMRQMLRRLQDVRE